MREAEREREGEGGKPAECRRHLVLPALLNPTCSSKPATCSVQYMGNTETDRQADRQTGREREGERERGRETSGGSSGDRALVDLTPLGVRPLVC